MSEPQPSPAPPISYRPNLPDWGVYLRWPADSDDWVHPEDVSRARQVIPSERVFRRVRWDGTYYHLQYGSLRLRVRPSLWLRVPALDLEVGQQVEVLSKEGRNDPGIYRIADILYSSADHHVRFRLLGDTLRLQKCFTRDDLKPLAVRHNLRVGFYTHPPPQCRIPADMDLLDVGRLTDEPP